MSSGDAKTNDRLERALQASLQPIDPGEGFIAALQSRLATARQFPSKVDCRPHFHHRPAHSASLALAASVVVALAVGWQLRYVQTEQHAQQTRLQQARDQLLLALEITSERLSLAQRRIAQYQSQEKNL
jgi:anti-sigma-K factor RskA